MSMRSCIPNNLPGVGIVSASLNCFVSSSLAVRNPLEDGRSAEDHEQADEVDIVVAAESLRQAAECLARITGLGQSGDVEEVLGVVFEK